jgi:hypothetical protein
LAGKAYFSYAFGFVEENNPLRASKLYIRGMKNCLKFLDGKSLFFDLNNEAFTKQCSKYIVKDFENLFWGALNFASWINLNKSHVDALNNMGKIEILGKKIIDSSPSYYFGGGHLLLALYYTSQPKILGGKPNIAKEHFEKCLEINKREFLPALFFYANYYAIPNQDKDLFVSLLKEIEAFNLEKLPAQRLPNNIIKTRAKNLLAQIDDLFLE